MNPRYFRRLLTPRFSMRMLLLLFTSTTLLLGWRTRAAQVTLAFSQAIKCGDIEAADAHFVVTWHDYLTKVQQADRFDFLSVEFHESDSSTLQRLLGHRQGKLKVNVRDNQVGYGAIVATAVVTPYGVDLVEYGAWESQLPPMLRWLYQ